jgi:cytochrome c biogenesis protein CcdA
MESFALACIVSFFIFVIGFTVELFKEWKWFCEWYGGSKGWELLLLNGLLMGVVWMSCSGPLVFGAWGIYWLITYLQWVQ